MARWKWYNNQGIVFNPNMPTEEVLSMPDRNNVYGKVVATKPLNYSGKLIENFWFEFEKEKLLIMALKKLKL